jgi:hypothetical protein
MYCYFDIISSSTSRFLSSHTFWQHLAITITMTSVHPSQTQLFYLWLVWYIMWLQHYTDSHMYVWLQMGALDWWTYLLTTYTHDSELQAITVLPLISTAPAKPSSSCSLAVASNSGDSSASHAQVLSSQSSVQYYWELTLSLAYNTSAQTR